LLKFFIVCDFVYVHVNMALPSTVMQLTVGNLARIVFLFCLLVEIYWQVTYLTCVTHLHFLQPWKSIYFCFIIDFVTVMDNLALPSWAFSMLFNLLMTVGAHKLRMWHWLPLLMSSRSLGHAINLFRFQNKLILLDQAISMIYSTISLTGVYSKG